MSAIKTPGAINEEKKIYKSLNFIGCKALKELLLTKRIKIAESQRSTRLKRVSPAVFFL